MREREKERERGREREREEGGREKEKDFQKAGCTCVTLCLCIVIIVAKSANTLVHIPLHYYYDVILYRTCINCGLNFYHMIGCSIHESTHLSDTDTKSGHMDDRYLL